MIQEYKFGLIIIDGKTYTEDVEVRWTGEVFSWERRESHIIDIDDVKRAVEQNPDTIILGTGASGLAGITEEAQRFIEEREIKLIVDRTEDATKTFNVINENSEEEEGEIDKVIGLFHLTC